MESTPTHTNRTCMTVFYNVQNSFMSCLRLFWWELEWARGEREASSIRLLPTKLDCFQRALLPSPSAHPIPRPPAPPRPCPKAWTPLPRYPAGANRRARTRCSPIPQTHHTNTHIHMQLNTNQHARTSARAHKRTHLHLHLHLHTRTHSRTIHKQAELGESSELLKIRAQTEPGEHHDDVKGTSELEGGFRSP